MKALLICPAIRPALAQLTEDRPLATVPILGECLVNHWIEHLASRGARQVIICASDRVADVRAAVGDGSRWGVQLEIVQTATELTVAEAIASFRTRDTAGWLPAPHDAVVMAHLPGSPRAPLFDSYASWYAAMIAWMPHALTPARVRVGEIRPGVWAGRRARISPRAQLSAPCWIGDQVFVGANAIIGPGAVLEDRAVVEVGARVVQSYVTRDTFVGRMTSVVNSLAIGSTLINWETDSSLRVPDPFLLCSLTRPWGTAATARVRSSLGRLCSAPWATFATWWARPRTTGFKLPG